MLNPKQKFVWRIREKRWVSYTAFLGGGSGVVAVIVWKIPTILCLSSSDKIWFTNKLVQFFFSLFLLSACLFFVKFCNSQNQRENHPTKQSGIKGQRFCLSHPSPLLILSFCLKQSAVLTGVGPACLHFFFFNPLLALEKPAKAPRRGQNFPLSSFS